MELIWKVQGHEAIHWRPTLVYPTPVFIIWTYDRNDRPNAMVAAWGGVCPSESQSVAISIRKVRYTYDNLMDRKAFTISVPSRSTSRNRTISVSSLEGTRTSSRTLP